MIKYEINPAFLARKAEIMALPVRFEQEGQIIYRGRNLIKIMTLDDLQINVKSFKRPHILNRFIYAWFRKSKAERSYGNALRLLGMGIGTPAPIAYLVYKNAKGVNRSYYISIQQPCDYVLLDLLQQRPPDFEELFRAYVRFVYEFHQKGVYFIDLSTGNTLISRGKDGEHRFYLVDLNRIIFKSRPLNPFEGMRNFCRIDLDDRDLDFVIREYALITKVPEADLRRVLFRYKRRETLRRQTKRRLKIFKRKRK